MKFGWEILRDLWKREMARAKSGRMRRVPQLCYRHIYRDCWTRLNVKPAKIMQVSISYVILVWLFIYLFHLLTYWICATNKEDNNDHDCLVHFHLLNFRPSFPQATPGTSLAKRKISGVCPGGMITVGIQPCIRLRNRARRPPKNHQAYRGVPSQ